MVFVCVTADLGGNLGLCLGASLLSVMEFGEFIMQACLSVFKRLQNTGKIKHEESNGEGSKEQGVYMSHTVVADYSY